MAMTDKSGKVVWRADELPFGEEYQTREMPERNDRRFLGKQLDKETGLVYMGARYLDPRTGRFTQPDPVGLVDPATGKVNQQMLLNPQRLNRYVYGLNNPYRYVDPEGDFAILAAYGGYIMASALAAGIAYYGGPIAADLGKKLHHVFWNEGNDENADASESLDKTDHAKDRINQGKEGDVNRQIGDPNRTVKEGRQFTDSKTGHNVHVKGNKVVVSDSKSGKQITQFKNSRSNTQKRIKSGRWVHKKTE